MIDPNIRPSFIADATRYRARIDAIDAVLDQSLRAVDLAALTWIDSLREWFQ